MKRFSYICIFTSFLFSKMLYPQEGQPVDRTFSISVNFAPFHSAYIASSSEASVEWNNTGDSSINACTESYAAVELHRHLCLLFNCELGDTTIFPIKLLDAAQNKKSIILSNLETIGQSAQIDSIADIYQLKDNLKEENSFALIPHDNGLFIIGHDRIGTLYGVYHLLERFGIRWYSPRLMVHCIPDTSQLLFPADIEIEKPKFLTRGFWAWENRGNSDFFIWMARNRLNFWTIAESNHPLLYKLGIKMTVGGHLHFYRFLNPNEEYPYNQPLFKGDDNKPQDVYPFSQKEYKGDTNKDRKLSYFEAHPEWYGLVDGKRKPPNGDFGTNICTSNDDAIAELTMKLVRDLSTGEWRDATVLNFWPLDGGAWCECPNCQGLGNPTDRLLKLIHQVRQAIAKAMQVGKIPHNVKVIFPIYHETTQPPSRSLPEDFDYENCIGTFFPISRCYGHYLDDSTCTEFNTPLWHDLQSWLNEEPHYYKGQFYMGEYYNVAPIKSLPALYIKMMAHDIPLYYQDNVLHCHYMHVYTDYLGMKRLNNYLFAKLLWNPQTDVSVLLSEYFDNTYHDYSADMRQLYQKLEFSLSNIKQLKHYRSLSERIKKGHKPLFPTEHFKLEEYHPQINDGVDLIQSVNTLKECREIMNRVKNQPLSNELKAIVQDDDKNLFYAENTVMFLYYLTQVVEAWWKHDLNTARDFYQLTIPYAIALTHETDIVKTSSAPANAGNGLEASGCDETFINLGKEMGFDFEAIKAFLEKRYPK
jgi:hypothetical protein